MWIIFTFVGLWHDLWCVCSSVNVHACCYFRVTRDRWRWLAWAWINCVCFSLEILFGIWFFAEEKKALGSNGRAGLRHTIRSSRYYRLVAALAATCNIM